MFASLPRALTCSLSLTVTYLLSHGSDSSGHGKTVICDNQGQMFPKSAYLFFGLILYFLSCCGCSCPYGDSDSSNHDFVRSGTEAELEIGLAGSRPRRQAGGPRGPPRGPGPYGPPRRRPYPRRRTEEGEENENEEEVSDSSSSSSRRMHQNPDSVGQTPSATLRRAAKVPNLKDGLADQYELPGYRYNSSLRRGSGPRLYLGESEAAMGRIPDTDLSALDAPRSGYPVITVLGIQERDPIPIKRVDASEVAESVTDALQLGRQDFSNLVMNKRPPKCILGAFGPGSKAPHPLLWIVAKPVKAAQYAYANEFALIRMANGYTNGNGEQMVATLDALTGEQGSIGADQCFVDEIRCNKKTPYRTFDGSCNNLEHPYWGAAKTGQIRATFAAYEDGIAAPRAYSVMSLINKERTNLPTAREVSISLSRGQSRPDRKTTMLMMQFAQFITHDVVRSPSELVQDPSKPSDFTLPDCCDLGETCSRHPVCDPIAIPPRDPFYGPFHVTCLQFIRMQPADPKTCDLKPRSPLNLNSHYLDASMTYGSSVLTAAKLRGPKGSLKINDSPILKGVVLPQADDQPSMSCHSLPERPCMFSGDARTNQHTGTVSMAALYVREHNRIAKYIDMMRPELPDEVVYQAARRIVIAEHQHITYNEYLPVLLGNRIWREAQNGLALKRNGYCTDCYQPSINPSISTEFAHNAFRTLHSTIPDWLPARNASGWLIPFWEHMLNPDMFYQPGMIDEVLTGFVKMPSESFDQIYSFNMQNMLFRMHSQPFGQDLFSFDIMRERETGNPSYLDLRAACGLPAVSSFEDLEDWMPPRAVANLARIYRHVLDIDGIAGALSEYPANGGEAIVGPTTACLIVEQFNRLKNGDRFWYENKQAKFTTEQLNEIRKSSIAAILCGSTPVGSVQPRAFLQDSPRNPVTPCGAIERSALQLEPFLDNLDPEIFPPEPAETLQSGSRRRPGGPGGYGGGYGGGPGGPEGPGLFDGPGGPGGFGPGGPIGAGPFGPGPIGPGPIGPGPLAGPGPIPL